MSPWITQIHHHDHLDSTMNEAARLTEAGAPHGTTVVARAQSAGRGRLGRSWHSEMDGGLWMTTLLRPHAPAGQLQQLSLVAGAAVYEALEKLGATGIQLKWPNDIQHEQRKLAGILLESSLGSTPTADESIDATVLIGIGINLKRRASLELPEELQPIYVGLDDILDPPRPPRSCLHAVVESLHAHYDDWVSTGLTRTLSLWQRADALVGQTVRAETPQSVVGTAAGLDDHGRLRIQTANDTVVAVDSGEVTLVRPG